MVALIKLKNVFVKFNHRYILSNISFTLTANRIFTFIGPNGAGKSTLIRIILGLLKPYSGKIVRKKNLNIGYVPQKLYFNTSIPITVNHFMKLSQGVKNCSIINSLKRVNAIHLKDLYLEQLSGGEMQRMLLARALLKSPELLVLDEFTQGIDTEGQIVLYELINQIRYELHCAIVIVSHDLNLVMAKTDEVLCLNNHICCSGTPESVYKNAEFIAMFGYMGTKEFAVYRHEHNHRHDF
ncbi:MAG TPA: zinc ABC transporter ATP-binding protein ZnuC [Buchnera sp. (in: enterobacteria)]|nr:zinc ABC transporter ATP-binding protein ZnuC [Buchnera sp. (in: enterobacteria)]